MKITITKHAEQRMRERLGINKKSCIRAAQIAYDKGIKHSDATGNLRRFLDYQTLGRGYECDWRIYGNYLYAFTKGGTLITVLHIKYSGIKKLVKGEEEIVEESEDISNWDCNFP